VVNDDDDAAMPGGVYTGGGYVPVTPLGPPPQSDPAQATVAALNACAHEWRAAGFDPNGDNRGLHLYCRRCGRVITPIGIVHSNVSHVVTAKPHRKLCGFSIGDAYANHHKRR